MAGLQIEAGPAVLDDAVGLGVVAAFVDPRREVLPERRELFGRECGGHEDVAIAPVAGDLVVGQHGGGQACAHGGHLR